jgi:hypothetical protein
MIRRLAVTFIFASVASASWAEQISFECFVRCLSVGLDSGTCLYICGA